MTAQTKAQKARNKLRTRDIRMTVLRVMIPETGEMIGALVPDHQEDLAKFDGPHYRVSLRDAYFRRPPIDRFMEKTRLVTATGCWNWIGSRLPAGYGRFSVAGTHYEMVLAHRWSYAYFTGPIADDLFIDHKCRNRRCVNPAHLEAVTPAENNRRSLPHRSIATEVACKHGHPWTDASRYVSKQGQIACRVCRQISWAGTMARKRSR